MHSNRLLIVGCDGLDWWRAHRLMDDGGMPHLQRLLETGACGQLASVPPFRRAVSWTCIATGCRPRRHGVAGPMELRPDGGGVLPSGRRSWQAPAFWELMAAVGLETAVVSWPATSPAPDWPGVMIDDRFAARHGDNFDNWPLPRLCVAPDRLREQMRALRIHPTDLDGRDLEYFAPALREIDQRADRRVFTLAATVAQALTTHAAATQLAEEGTGRMLAVHYGLLAQVQRRFLHYRDADDPTVVRHYGGIVDAAYRFQDMMLGRMLELCGDGTDVVVVSASGYSTMPPMDMPAGTETGPLPTPWGMLVASGPSFAPDRLLQGASVLDVAPTVLAAVGIAAGEDTEGIPLAEAFARPTRPTTAAAYVRPTPPVGLGERAAAALRALGYDDTPSSAQYAAFKATQVENLVNLGRSQLELGDFSDAANLLRQALRIDTGHAGGAMLLARCYAQLDRWDAAVPFAKAMLARDSDAPWGHLLQGAVHAIGGDVAAAQPFLDKARVTGRDTPLVQLYLGLLALRLGDIEAATRCFERAIALRPGYAEAMTGLGMALWAGGDADGAEHQLRRAIGLRYHQPLAHFELGKLLASCGRLVEALAALRVVLQLDADYPAASETTERIAAAIRDEASGGIDFG